jgi:hypothetical protein
MATGNRVVPEAPVTAEHTGAGRPAAAEQANWAAQGFAAGPGTPAPAPSAGYLPVPGGSRAGRVPPRPWRGAGGRWLVWVFRAVLWASLLLIGYRGVAAIVTGYPGALGFAPSTSGRGQAFPSALAKAYALEFGQAYLNFSPARAEQRATSLAAFVPPGADPELGWNGVGTQTLQSEQVAGVRVLSPHRAVVTLLARVNGRLVEIGVPIFAAGGALVVSGHPALLAPPSQVVPPASASAPQDLAAKQALLVMLRAFFRAYASGDALQIGRFTVAGDPVIGLGGVVTFGGISHLGVPTAAGQARQVTVAVVWRVASTPPAAAKAPAVHAAITMTYALTVVRHGGTWRVRSIGPAATQPWPSS